MNAQGPKLRLAVATGPTVAVWQAACIEAICAIPGVSLVRWLQVAEVPERPGARTGRRALAPARSLLDSLASGPPEAGEVPDVLLDLSGMDHIEDEDAISEVWRFRYGPSQIADVFRAGLESYVYTPGLTQVALVRDSDRQTLREGWLSWWRGELLDRLLLDPSPWPAQAAMDWLADAVARRGGPSDDSKSPSDEPAMQHGRRTAPLPILRLASVGRRLLDAREALIHHDNWNFGFLPVSIGQVLEPQFQPEIHWMPTRPGHFAADPFGIERDGVLHILFEDYEQRIGRGSIGHVTIAHDGAISEPHVVLDVGVHASYPYLIESGGDIFMAPETSAAGELALYHAVGFPDRWERVAVLLSDVPAVDATIFEHAGRWWMFATRSDQGPSHSLSVWFASDLLGPWTAHAKNPVKIDARSSRPGGTPFVVDGSLYRPAQDDAGTYGGRLVINRIVTLSPTEFVETPVKVIPPPAGSPYPDGLHTLSAAGGRTLVDGNVRRLAMDTLRLTLGARARRVLPGKS